MREVNFEDYEIQIGAIWNFEKEMFRGNENDSMEFMIVFNKKVEAIIIEQGKPFLSIKDNPEGYNKNVELIKQATYLRDSVKLPFFVEKDNFYYFDQNIIVSKDHKDFDYFFILKLIQYDSGLNPKNSL